MPASAELIEFCVAEECAEIVGADGTSSVVVADDPGTYGYRIVIGSAGADSLRTIEGEVVTEEFFVNGEGCEPRTANATLLVDDNGAVEVTTRSRPHQPGSPAAVSTSSVVSCVHGRGCYVSDEDIRRFLREDYDRVVRVVTLVCGERQRAEDAVQDTLIDVWTKDRHVDDLPRWVTVAAINRARSRWRSLSAERRAFDRRLADVLGSLPHMQRQVVVLHYLVDLSVIDIAEYLGVAAGTGKTHLHRGRASSRDALADDTGGEV